MLQYIASCAARLADWGRVSFLVLQAVVIAAALSMSSSAFVLQLLGERGESPTRVGSATLGILLFQDIAVVPFLVLLPLIESHGGMEGASADTLLQVGGRTTRGSAADNAHLVAA